MASTDDSDVPETGAVFTFGKSSFAENVPSKFWVKNDKVLEVVCGDAHTALITDTGRIFMFGNNSYGQLGLGHTQTATKPSCIKSLKTEKCRLVACGQFHTIVATESGKIYSFGGNSDGQLGVEDINDSNVPVHIESLEPTPYSMLAAGAHHSAALTDDGRVFVWGDASEGQLGLDHNTEVYTPKELPFDENAVCISCGYHHTAVVTESGALYTFGETQGGKLGLGDDIPEYATPQHVSSITEKVKSVACGGSHTVALTENGKVYTFGEGLNGQLGLGTSILEATLPQLLHLNFKISQVACGENFTALISERGHLYTFGDGRHGKLGQGQESFSNQFKPCKVDRFTKFEVQKAACGGCQLIVTAQHRTENGVEESEDEIDEAAKTLNHSLKISDLNGSVPARVRRRQTMPTYNANLNRTLPVLSNNRNSAVLNGNVTVPALRKNILPEVKAREGKLRKQKKLDSQEESEEEDDAAEKKKEKKVVPQPLPRGSPKGQVPQHKKADESEDEGMESAEEEGRGTEEKLAEEKKEEDDDKWSADEEEEEDDKTEVKEEQKIKEEEKVKEEELEEEELSDEEKDEDEPRSLSKPVPVPRKKEAEKKESEDEEEEGDDEEEEKEDKKGKKDKKDKKDKKKDKKKKKGLFGRKGGESEEDEEADDEDDKEKEVKKEEEEEKGKKKKDKKDKKEKKKKGKKDKEEDKKEDEEEKEEKEDKKSKKKDKKEKNKDKKGKKDKDKKDEEDEEEEEKEDANDKESDKKEEEGEKKEEEVKPPKKKSRFCTIL